MATSGVRLCLCKDGTGFANSPHKALRASERAWQGVCGAEAGKEPLSIHILPLLPAAVIISLKWLQELAQLKPQGETAGATNLR